MRWLPRSLFGRLVLVLSIGLTVALIGSAAINLRERHHILEHAGVERFAQRISTMARLIDRLTPEDRRALARVMSDPHSHMRIAPAPPPDRGVPLPAPLAQLHTALAGDLGRGYPVQVVSRAPAPPAAHDHPRGSTFTVAVKLHDGSWLTIADHHPPPQPPDDNIYSLLIKLGILLVVALLLSFLAVTWITRPLGMLAEAARGLGRDIRRPPLPETGPTEVRRAAAAFNLMQQRLLGFLDSRLRTLTAISHDLKTPVTRLRLRAEMLEDSALRDGINRDLDDMDGMLTAALGYLRGEDEVPLRLDVNALLESMAADAQALDQPVTVEGRAASPYSARPRALRRGLDNLVQNALRYGKEAQIRVEERPGALVIRVADRGPGLPEDELERVFEPFYRYEASRNRETGGTGLGLAIARGVAEAHGGTLTLANRPEGGLEATLTLPR
jgi:signal transduction histidine kinase